MEADGVFRAAHDCLFLWLDAALGMLEWYTFGLVAGRDREM